MKYIFYENENLSIFDVSGAFCHKDVAAVSGVIYTCKPVIFVSDMKYHLLSCCLGNPKKTFLFKFLSRVRSGSTSGSIFFFIFARKRIFAPVLCSNCCD